MIVLNTHTWFWWINLEHKRFPAHWLALLESADVIGVSPVSCFERTYITEGMALLRDSVLKRLNERGGDPVVQL